MAIRIQCYLCSDLFRPDFFSAFSGHLANCGPSAVEYDSTFYEHGTYDSFFYKLYLM